MSDDKPKNPVPEEREERYQPQSIERKWQARWDGDAELYRAEGPDSARKKYYVLEMLPYPSGEPHMGHLKNYALGDAVARHRTVERIASASTPTWARSRNSSRPPMTVSVTSSWLAP